MNYEQRMKTHQEQASVLIKQGNLLRKEGKLEQAIEAYLDALELVPAYGSLYQSVGDMHFEQKNYPAAVKAYQAALDFMPEIDLAWSNLGQCLLFHGKSGEALAAFEKALHYHPQDALAHYYIGAIQIQQGKTKTAAKSLKQALLLRPDWEAHAREDARFKALFENGSMGRSRKWWQFWKRKSPEPPR